MATASNVRLARGDDVAGMAACLAKAFEDDPVMRWLFGDRPPRPTKYTRTFFAHEGRRHLKHGSVYVADDATGAAYWDPPGYWKTTIVSMLPMAPTMLGGIGPRLTKALRTLSRMEKKHEEFPDHHYLAVLGTHPDHRGAGTGAALMAPVLDRCDADGVGAYLESSKETNVPYYRRYGFEVVGEITFPGGPTIWPMWRDPRPSNHGE